MIRLEGVHKSYRVLDGPRRVVLDRCSLEFPPGRSVGILGRNGAGKSTLIRLLAGTELPDQGRVVRRRRVSFPLGYSGTFHPYLSGRENLRFLARVYGADERRTLRFVEEFAELGDYMRMPVATLSAGMRARLAFGACLAIPFDVLIDEVTAVGDARFQARCLEAFEARAGSADVVLVSHDLRTVRSYCDAGGVLRDGKLILFNGLEDALAAARAEPPGAAAPRGLEPRRVMDGGTFGPGPRDVEPSWSPVLPAPQRRRGWGKVATFVLVAMLPALGAAAFLFLAASDQYVSEFRFSVRQSQPSRPEAPMLGEGFLAGPAALPGAADAEIVVQYVRSHQILLDLAGTVDLDRIYGRPDADWLARLGPEESAEGRLRHWRRFVDAYLDRTSGLVTVQVSAFGPHDARHVAASVLAASERLVNGLSDRARQDRVAHADRDVDQAEARLRRAGLALGAYRNRYGVLFPAMHAAENTGLDGRLRGQLAQADAALAAMRTQGLSPDAPQVRALQVRADALRAEQRKLSSELTQREAAKDPAPGQQDAPGEASTPLPSGTPALASVLGGYDQLEVERTLAERAYDRAVLAQRQAQAQAAQQQVYLAAFVQPNLPQEPLRPRRWRLLAEAALGGFALWALGCLLYYGVRDHLD